MLKITKITAAQAKNYYAKDDHYYVKTEILSEWTGELAQDLDLKGQVEADDFEALLEGNLPNGARLPGKGNNAEHRRAGFDATFSAPKSFSVAALLQDDRLIQIHRRAVKTVLSVAESRYAQDREWNCETKTVEVKQTGKFAIALFDHDTSRDLDPNLHTHAVILNGTQDRKGSYRSLYTDELYANRKLLDDVYLNELAYGARELGYEIEPTKDGFELAGYDKELRDTFSQRRKAIEQHVAKELEPGAVATGRQYQQAALKTRTQKRETNRESLIRDWQEVLEAKKLALPIVPTVAEPEDLAFSGQLQSVVAALEGIHHAEERESVFKRGKVERFALEHHLGLQSWKQLQTEIVKTEQLIQVDATRDCYTTQSAIGRERETVSLMRRGQGKVQPIATRDRVNEIAPDTLTAAQRAALELSVTTTDQTVAWQGVAGAGKSYALNLYRQLATEAGYRVLGFAPSAAAATVLGEEASMPSDTVASLLNSKMGSERDALGISKSAHSTSEIWVIDESGLLSAKDAHALLKRASAQNARVLLVGDTKQLSAVEAGNPFKSLQQHGIEIAYLEESLRQKEERLKAAVDAISKGDLGSGFYHLDQAGSIRAVETQAARGSKIVEDYLALSPYQRSRTLIVANTNVERRSITEGIRAGLQAEGRLAANTFTMTSLKPCDWTLAEAKYAKQYDCGDVIVPIQDYRKQQLVKGQQYSVVEIDEARNRLKVAAIDGEQFELDPGKCDRKTVYKTESIAIAPGDQLRWTKNDRTENRRNRQEFTIEGLDERGQAIVRDKDNKTAFIDLSGRQFADYAIVSTTYAAQGKTADRVLAALDQSTGKESFYVAASRARHELALYTTDAVELRQLAARSRANENASDYVNLFTYEKSYAQNQTRTTETATRRANDSSTDDRANRGVSIGSCASKRLAATLQGDRRTETSTGDLDRSLDQLSRATALSRIETDAISDNLAAFVERRTLCRNGSAITDALESIADNLNQIERHCRELAERDATIQQRAGILNHLDLEHHRDLLQTVTAALRPEEQSLIMRLMLSGEPQSAIHVEQSDSRTEPQPDLWVERDGMSQPAIQLWREWSEASDSLLSSDMASEASSRRSTASEAVDLNEAEMELDPQIELVPPPPEVAAFPQPLTLETAHQLTSDNWLELTPRQQLTLVGAARRHQATEPRGYAQAEQWVGQRSGLQQQLDAAKAEEAAAREILQDIKDRGERSLFNPFGATKLERSEARIELSTVKESRQRLEAEIKGIDDRQAERERQDAARRDWRMMPQTQGAEQILALIEQPQLKRQFQSVERLSGQLQRWREVAQSDGSTIERIEAIQSVKSVYLDGQGLSGENQRTMQQDLEQARQHSQKRDQGWSL